MNYQCCIYGLYMYTWAHKLFFLIVQLEGQLRNMLCTTLGKKHSL